MQGIEWPISLSTLDSEEAYTLGKDTKGKEGSLCHVLAMGGMCEEDTKEGADGSRKRPL